MKTWEKMGKIKGAIGTATFLKRPNDSSVKRKKSKFMLQCINWSQGSGRNSPHHFQHRRTAQSFILWLTKVYVSSSITLLTSTLSSCTYCHCSSVSNSPSPLWNFKYKILRKSNFSQEKFPNIHTQREIFPKRKKITSRLDFSAYTKSQVSLSNCFSGKWFKFASTYLSNLPATRTSVSQKNTTFSPFLTPSLVRILCVSD